MIEVKIREDDEYIKLGQFLKKCGIASSGTEAKYYIEEKLIKVNGEIIEMRGKKLIAGDIVEFDNQKYQVTK